MNYIILLSEPCFLFSSTNFFYISQINNLVLWLHGYHDQIEIINDLPADKTITVYRCGPLVDLCRGPHIPNTSFVKAIACLKVCLNYLIMQPFLLLIYPLTYQWQVLWFNWLSCLEFQASSAYWRGDKDRESLQRVYGISYPDQKSLKVIFISYVISLSKPFSYSDWAVVDWMFNCSSLWNE